MIGLIGVMGGAAALEIRRLRHHRGQDDKDGQVKELKKTVEQYAKELEQERRVAAAAAERANALAAEADGLRRDTDHLRGAAESLGRNKEELAQQNAQLLLTNLKLKDESQQLVEANRLLTEKMTELSAEREAEAAHFAAELAALRDRVAGVLQRMFSSEIDEGAAVEALRELGCEVTFVPDTTARTEQSHTSEPSYTFAPSLLLDDPAKMARLMQAALSQSTSGALSPRLLEGSSTTGSLTPRFARDSASQRAMQATLNISGASSTSGASTPRFTLSWLGGAPESTGLGTSSANAAVQQQGVEQQLVKIAQAKAASDVPRGGGDNCKDENVTSGGSLGKSVNRSNGCVEQGGNLVFASQAKGTSTKSRLGLSLTDASGIFGSSKKGASVSSGRFDQAMVAGQEDTGSDLSGSKDLVARK